MERRAAKQKHVTTNLMQVSSALNVPEQFVLVPVLIRSRGDSRHTWRPCRKEVDWDAVSVNYDVDELTARSEPLQ